MSVDHPANGPLLEKSIGAVVRRRRSQMGMAAAVLARTSGLSPGMLSRIERGLISPSLTTLQALAQALHVPMGTLFSSFDDPQRAVFTQAGAGPAASGHDPEAVRCELLGRSGHAGNLVTSQLFDIASGSENYPELPAIGVLFLYVVAGGLTYSHGPDAFPMLPGDSLLFDAETPHHIETISAYPTRLLAVNSLSVNPLTELIGKHF